MNLSYVLVTVAAIVCASADPIKRDDSEPYHGFVTIPKIKTDPINDQYTLRSEYGHARDDQQSIEHQIRKRQVGPPEESIILPALAWRPARRHGPSPDNNKFWFRPEGHRDLDRPGHIHTALRSSEPEGDSVLDHIREALMTGMPARRQRYPPHIQRADKHISRKRRVDDRMYAARTECELRMGNKHSKKRDDAKRSRYYLVDGKDARYGKSRRNKHHLKAKSEDAPCTHKRSSAKSDGEDDEKVNAKRVDKMDYKTEELADKLWKLGTFLRSFSKLSGDDTNLGSKSDDKDDKPDVGSKRKSDDKKTDKKRTDAKSGDGTPIESIEFAASSAVKSGKVTTRAKRHADKFGGDSKAGLKRHDGNDDDDDDDDYKRQDDGDDDDDKKTRHGGDGDGDDTETRHDDDHDDDDDDQANAAKIEYVRKRIYKRQGDDDDGDDKEARKGGDDHKAASARRGKRHAIVTPTPLKIYKHKNLRRSGRDVSKSRSKRAIIQQDQYFIVHPQADDDDFHMNAKSIANKRLDAAQKMYDNMMLKYRGEDDMLKDLRDELGLHYDDRDDVTLERRDDDVTFERDDDVTFERDDDVTFERDDDVTFERDDDVTFERDDVTLERDDVTLERDDVTLERDDVTLERDDVTLERDDVTLERVDKSAKKARSSAKLKPRRDLFVKDKRHEDILLRRG